MASITFVQLLIFASCAVGVYSLRCYHCVREDNPDALKFCKLPSSALGNNEEVNCSSVEDRCAITKTIEKDGTVKTFRRMCEQSSKCMSTECSSPDGQGTVICRSCCKEDLCNKGEGPKSGEGSGASRITIATVLYTIGGILFCSWLV